MSRRGQLRRVFLDTAPLRLDRDYRWLWAAHVTRSARAGPARTDQAPSG